MTMYLKLRFNSASVALNVRNTVTAFFSVVVIVSSSPSYAASCHAGSGGQSIAILSPGQRYQLGVSISYRLTEGFFDPYGYYSSNQRGYSVQSTTTTLGCAYRLVENLQAAFNIPIVHNRQALSGKRLSSTSVGDPIVEVRYSLWEDAGVLLVPEIALYSGVRIPLGTSSYSSSDSYKTDVVSDGLTAAHMGLNISKLLRPLKFTLDGTFFHPFSKKITEMRGEPISAPYVFKSGNSIQSLEGLSLLLSDRWSVSTGLKQLWQFKGTINGKEISGGSAARLFTAPTALNFFPHRSLNFSATYEGLFPFYRYAVNQPNAHSVSIAAVYSGW